MQYADMLMLLQGRGVDTENFDKLSRKTLCQLHKEIEERDVVLAYDKKICRLVRVAMSVKVLIIAEGYQLNEVKREYRNGSSIGKTKEWSISETRKRGENVSDAAIRGLREECGLKIRPDQLTILSLADEIDTHESSVYAGIVSSVCIQHVRLELPRMPWKGNRVIDDDGVKIHTRWSDLRKR